MKPRFSCERSRAERHFFVDLALRPVADRLQQLQQIEASRFQLGSVSAHCRACFCCANRFTARAFMASGQSPVRPFPRQPVHQRPVAPSFHPPQQLPYPARTDGQLFPRLYLRDVPLPHLMQHLQSIAIFPRHPQLLLSLRHALSKRNFLLGSKRNFSCGCDTPRSCCALPA